MYNYEMKVSPKIAEDGSTYWTVSFPSVPNCVGGGDTAEEAINEAKENLEFYLEYLREECKPIPAEDFKATEYSGKIALRISKSTHKRVAQLAESEGISTNALLNNAIENYIGLKTYDMNLNKKIDDLKAIADASLYLQNCNALFNQKMWGKFSKENVLLSKGVKND